MLSFSHLLSEMNTFKCPQLDILLNTFDTQIKSFLIFIFTFHFLSTYKVPQVCRRLFEVLDTMVGQNSIPLCVVKYYHFCCGFI